MKKTFLIALVLIVLLLDRAAFLMAENILDKLAHDNIPSWLLQRAQSKFEERNLAIQKYNDKYQKRIPLKAFRDPSEMIKWVCQSIEANKEKYIFILYDYNGVHNAFVVLKKGNKVYLKIYQSSPTQVNDLYGIGPLEDVTITGDDLDGDYKPEIIVQTSADNRWADSSCVIIKWQDSSFYVAGSFLNVEFADLDKDGIEEIIQSIKEVGGDRQEVFKWNEKKYIFDEALSKIQK